MFFSIVARQSEVASRTFARASKLSTLGATPWPRKPPGMWSTALTGFAKSSHPRTNLPEGVYLRHDEHTLAIRDGYPKAKFHFLVLPRLPFPLDADEKQGEEPKTVGSHDESAKSVPRLGLAGGKLSLGTSSKGKSVPDSHLHSLSDLLASPYAAIVLARLRRQGEQVKKLIQEEMVHAVVPPYDEPVGVQWDVRLGFHAIPSMDTVHLHVISNDLDSPALKRPKHYHSFNFNRGFWLELDDVEELVRQGKKELPHTRQHYESLLKGPLISFRTGEKLKNITPMKFHLLVAWREEIALKRSAMGAQGEVAKKEREGPPPSRPKSKRPRPAPTELEKEAPRFAYSDKSRRN